MIKRNIAILLVAGIVLGGGALALAQGPPDRSTVEPSAAQAPDDRKAARQARREAARKCMQDAGEDLARRQQCRQQFKAGKAGKGAWGGPLRRAVHGDLVVGGADGRFEKLVFDRGTLNQASDATKIVIDRPDGQQVTLALTDQTRYRGVQGANQLRKGEPAVVTSRDGKALTVAQRDPNQSGQKGADRGGNRGGNKQGPPGVPND
ncbi:MAG: hypothetical protein M3396_01880 [Actinomycetota bacterium]|nr:hypothetical protein [Actinomycetota bacterium]